MPRNDVKCKEGGDHRPKGHLRAEEGKKSQGRTLTALEKQT